MPIEKMSSKITGRVAVVGVGDIGHGDDGAGPMAAEMLEELGFVDVIDSGPTPELDTWRLREIAPDSVVFIDAVDFGASPGDIAFLEAEDMRPEGFDTHHAPLRMTMRYLENELACKCLLLAIQPKTVGPGRGISGEVRRSVRVAVNLLRSAIGRQRMTGES